MSELLFVGLFIGAFFILVHAIGETCNSIVRNGMLALTLWGLYRANREIAEADPSPATVEGESP